jgi:hypothetical protein
MQQPRLDSEIKHSQLPLKPQRLSFAGYSQLPTFSFLMTTPLNRSAPLFLLPVSSLTSIFLADSGTVHLLSGNGSFSALRLRNGSCGYVPRIILSLSA